jgi:hypothetical protein
VPNHASTASFEDGKVARIQLFQDTDAIASGYRAA